MFWTVPVPDETTWVQFGYPEAMMHIVDMPLLDQGDLVNALMGGPSVPATASFKAHWFAPSEKMLVRDDANGYQMEYVETDMRTAWHASSSEVSFVSDPMETSRNHYSLLARERNGRFLP